ncbi:MAG: type IV pilus twitching motility protein PilT, partial [Actinomycetota bacterium]
MPENGYPGNIDPNAARAQTRSGAQPPTAAGRGPATAQAIPAGAPPGPPRATGSAMQAESEAERHESALLANLMGKMLEIKASDLHLSAGNPPMYRIKGELVRTEGDPLKPQEIQRMMYAILTQRQREAFEADLELDFSYALPGKARFRVNIYRQRDAMGAAMRLIPFEIKTLEDLGVPNQVAQFAQLPRGLVLVTGPTGSGKSTTLAALIDIINSKEALHIMTIEDPIEFLHHHKQSAVHQRELGADTHSFAAALKHVLRQDPDVILVGEMRDLDTIQLAITAAETGHLVFATLHTNSAPSSVDRIIDVFPPHQQQQIRIQLASSLQGVVTQTLLPTADGKGRVAACEILVVTPAVANLIRETKTHQIFSS